MKAKKVMVNNCELIIPFKIEEFSGSGLVRVTCYIHKREHKMVIDRMGKFVYQPFGVTIRNIFNLDTNQAYDYEFMCKTFAIDTDWRDKNE